MVRGGSDAPVQTLLGMIRAREDLRESRVSNSSTRWRNVTQDMPAGGEGGRKKVYQ